MPIAQWVFQETFAEKDFSTIFAEEHLEYTSDIDVLCAKLVGSQGNLC